jgi:hypothetical protein
LTNGTVWPDGNEIQDACSVTLEAGLSKLSDQGAGMSAMTQKDQAGRSKLALSANRHFVLQSNDNHID